MTSGGIYLIESLISVRPKSVPPSVIKSFYAAILILQPASEIFLAIFTKAISGIILVGNVPEHYTGML
jgi:hypothetical protein